MELLNHMRMLIVQLYCCMLLISAASLAAGLGCLCSFCNSGVYRDIGMGRRRGRLRREGASEMWVSDKYCRLL